MGGHYLIILSSTKTLQSWKCYVLPRHSTVISWLENKWNFHLKSFYISKIRIHCRKLRSRMLGVSLIGLTLTRSFVKIVLLFLELQWRSHHQISQLMFSFISMRLICDKERLNSKFGIFELLVQKETFADALLTGIVS